MLTDLNKILITQPLIINPTISTQLSELFNGSKAHRNTPVRAPVDHTDYISPTSLAECFECFGELEETGAPVGKPPKHGQTPHRPGVSAPYSASYLVSSVN